MAADVALQVGGAEAGRAPRSDPWRRIAGACVPPLVAVLLGWALLAYSSGSPGRAVFSPSTWARWDSAHYLSIASGGYWVVPCPERLTAGLPPANYLCGNAGWFPGYPTAIRWLSGFTGILEPVAGLVLAWTCWYLVLLLMWLLLADSRSLPSRWCCLLLAAFFPGQVYFAALFPISLCVCATLGCLYAVFRASGPAGAATAAVTGFVAAYSYLTAVALVPALLVTAVLAVRGRRRLQVLIAALGVLGGFAAVLLTMRQAVGVWNAYFLSAQKYQVGVHFPLDTLRDRLSPLWMAPVPGREDMQAIAAQTLLALFLVVLATAVTVARGARRLAPRAPAVDSPSSTDSGRARWRSILTGRISAFDLTFLVAALGVWAMPYVAGGQASTYRSEAFMVLAVPLLRRLPWWLLAVPLAAAVLVAWHMAPHFFTGALV